MISISETTDELLNKVAEYFIAAAGESIAHSGRFSVALSGGSSPKKLYELLASGLFRERVEWSKVYFFFGDERYVPFDDPASNFLMAKKALFEPLGIPGWQIFPVDTGLQPKEAASFYMDQINLFFGKESPRFDLVLLGLGDNSHTASLFPHTPVLHNRDVDVKEVFLPDEQVFRITFTAPLINIARRIAFLVYGAAKAEAVFNVIQGTDDYENFPARLVRPENGELFWFLDKEAAGKLPPESL